MKRKLSEFMDWLGEVRKPIVFGMAIGGFIVYIYTVDQLVRDCQVMKSFRVAATVFECKESK